MNKSSERINVVKATEKLIKIFRDGREVCREFDGFTVEL